MLCAVFIEIQRVAQQNHSGVVTEHEKIAWTSGKGKKK
jgi:hypothetical protein